MSPETIDIQPASINPNSARPANRRTHYHVGQDLKSAQRRQQCLALRLEGLHLHEIAQRLGVSKSSVHAHLQQAQALSHAAIAQMGAQLLEQERAKLQAIVDRWLPVATGSRRAKEAARAAEIVRKTSDRLRVLYGLPVPPELPKPAAAPVAKPEAAPEAEVPDPELELLSTAYNDIVLRMAQADLLPTVSYYAALEALDAWQPGKYQEPVGAAEEYLRIRWQSLLENWID